MSIRITPDKTIALGIAEHESLKMSYLNNKILVTKGNIFNKAYVKWYIMYSEYAPASSNALIQPDHVQPAQ